MKEVGLLNDGACGWYQGRVRRPVGTPLEIRSWGWGGRAEVLAQKETRAGGFTSHPAGGVSGPCGSQEGQGEGRRKTMYL